MDNVNFKAAFVTNDGVTISKHFGPSKLYNKVEVIDGQIKSSVIVEKPNFHSGHNHNHDHSNCNSSDNANKHNEMLKVIGDCDYLIVGGMGYGMYNHLTKAGIEAIMTDEDDIVIALEKILRGELISKVELVH